MKIRTFLNYEPSKKEVFTESSQTVPNLSYTIRQLLERSTVGLLPDVKREPIYIGETDDPALMHGHDFDLSEIDAIKKAYDIENQAIMNKLKEKQKLQQQIDKKDENNVLENATV